MQEDLKLEVEKTEERCIVRAAGHLNAETSDRLAEELEECFREGPRDTDMDFTDIELIGSPGFKVLLKTHRRLEAAGNRLNIRNVPFKISAVMRSLGFDKVFNLE